MKNLFFAASLFVMAIVGSVNAHAYNYNGSPEAFEACMNSDESWYRRWGQYLVSYDYNEAVQSCRSAFYGGEARRMGCNVNGGWVTAGYYCQEFTGGP